MQVISAVVFWLAVFFFAAMVIWRIFRSIFLVVVGFKDGGFGGGMYMMGLVILLTFWDLAKLAFWVLIFTLLVQWITGNT